MTPLRRVRRWQRLAPVLGLGLLACAWAAPAAAQDASARLVLRAVVAQDSDAVDLVLSYSGDEADLGDVAVRENGHEVDASTRPFAETGLQQDVVLLFDTSSTTDANAMLAKAVEAANAFLDDLPAGVRVGVATAGGAAQLLRQPTDDLGRVREALAQLTPAGEGAVLSGVVRAADVAEGEGTLPSVVLFTDGVEDSNTDLVTARGALFDGGTALYVVGLQDGGLDEAAFGSLATQTGGHMVVTSDPNSLSDALAGLSHEIVPQVVATYSTEESVGVQDIDVRVGDAEAAGSYVSGSTLIGVNRVVDRPQVEPGGIAFFRTTAGKTLGIGAAVLAAALFAYAMIALFIVREKTALSQALQPYSDGYSTDAGDDEDSGLAQTAFLQRAVELTGQFAERQGLITKLERTLEKADLPLRAAEALFFYVAAVILVFFASAALTQNVMGTLIITVLVLLTPPAVLNFLATRKKKAFEALLPDTLQLLSSTLRAGYSMMQGVEAVSVEAAEPMGKELRRVVTEARLGRPLEESLEAVADRMESADFGWAVMAIRIQREVGGNLSELLLTVAETMTERERLRRDVNALTAEGRISAYVLIALPLGLGGFLLTINPDYIGKLFDVTLGQIMLGGAALGIAVGYAWMMKIIKIEI